MEISQPVNELKGRPRAKTETQELHEKLKGGQKGSEEGWWLGRLNGLKIKGHMHPTWAGDLFHKRSDLVHWEDLKGSGGEGGGRGDRDGEYM